LGEEELVGGCVSKELQPSRGDASTETTESSFLTSPFPGWTSVGDVATESMSTKAARGGCHDQADVKWIVIKGLLRGVTDNDTPKGQPAPGWPIGRPGVGRPGVGRP
jgi:hypothetical protein